MTEQKNVLKGKVLPTAVAKSVASAAEKISSADALNALNQIVVAVRESIQTHEQESTKREKLRAYRETELARIKASEGVLRDYFDRIFEERREANAQLFASLDVAIEAGDISAIQAVVGGIVEVARISPLANIGDLGELRRAMDDPNTVFEF